MTNPNDSNPPSVTPMTFSYLPGALISSDNYQNACDFSVSASCDGNTAHQDWANVIKIQALNAYKEAFTNLPAIVSKQVAADMQYGGSNNPRFEHTVYIDGSWFASGEGLTTRGDFSWVFYPKVIFNAEIALGPYGQSQDYTPPFSDLLGLLRLLAAVGRGIGNAAAHETGHQIAFTVPMPGMECGPESPVQKPCEGGINSVYEAAAQNVWDFLPYNPPKPAYCLGADGSGGLAELFQVHRR